MITEKVTKNQIEKWKLLYENNVGKLKPNRKSGEEIDGYFKNKYAYKSINCEKFKSIVEYNVLSNDFSREKLKGEKPNVNCYMVGDIYVGIDIVSGEIHVECENIEKASAIYDDLFAFRGLDETDLKNYVLVGQYIELQMAGNTRDICLSAGEEQSRRGRRPRRPEKTLKTDKTEIKELSKEQYAGRKFTAKYKTNGYYDIYASRKGFEIEYKTFETTVEKTFDDEFFGEWLESPIAFGAFENGELLGFVEGSMESWNNRFRISNICVFDDTNRNKGLGRVLMNTIEKAAKSYDPRMIVLETQTCNEAAIKFYQKCGYSVIGFDMYAYTNDDPERKEVRIEMGKKLK